jgi:hypothetical protein
LSSIQVDNLLKRDGSTFPLGKIGQVLQTTHTTQVQTSSTSFVDSGIDVTITPSTTSSKVLLMTSTSAIHTATTSQGGETLVKFYADDVDIGDEYQVAKSRQNGSYNQESGGGGTCMFLHSPSTSSSVKYSIYVRIDAGTNGRLCQAGHGLTFTAMEVLA